MLHVMSVDEILSAWAVRCVVRVETRKSLWSTEAWRGTQTC